MAGQDSRHETYDDLHKGQLSQQEERNADSARKILTHLFEMARAESVIDVGSGLGTWLKTAQEMGVETVQGVEGEWIKTADLKVDLGLIHVCDLEQGFDLKTRFDLVITLEVGEHLAPEAAEVFVESLCRHGDVVLFSAAIPFQGGHHHVNEQFLSYWMELFAKHGYRPLDVIRPLIWDDEAMLWWLRQNIVVFANGEGLAKYPKLAEEGAKHLGPISVVHPKIYMDRLAPLYKQFNELVGLQNHLAQGGTFKAGFKPSGEFTVVRIGD